MKRGCIVYCPFAMAAAALVLVLVLVVESHNSWASGSLCIRLFWHSELLRRRRSA
jgi:hypothetical protein